MTELEALWQAAKEANPWLRSEQFLDLIADDARVFLEQTKQRGLDRRGLRALIKEGKQEAEVAKELAELLKRFGQWLESENRSPATRATLKQEFQEFLDAFRKRETLQGIVDPLGHVGTAVKVQRPSEALGKVIGTDLENALKTDYKEVLKRLGLEGSKLEAVAKEAEQVLSDFLKAWETRRPAEKIEQLMNDFAKEHEKTRKEILKLQAEEKALTGNPVNKIKAEKIKEDIRILRDKLTEHGRDKFASARKAVLQEALDDPEVYARLKSVGLVLEKTQGGATVSFKLDLGKPQWVNPEYGKAQAISLPQDVSIKLNIDHSKVDFADAIDNWIKTGESSALHPVLAGSNMRIATGLENQVLFNYLKKDVEKWGQSLSQTAAEAKALSSSSATTHSALDVLTGQLRVDKVVRDIEELLGHSLGWRERDAVRDYVDMAMQMTRP